MAAFVERYKLVSWEDYMLAFWELDRLAFLEHYKMMVSVEGRLVSLAPCMLALAVPCIGSLMVVRTMVEPLVEHMLALEVPLASVEPCILVACMLEAVAYMLVVVAYMLVVLEQPLEPYMLGLVSVMA